MVLQDFSIRFWAGDIYLQVTSHTDTTTHCISIPKIWKTILRWVFKILWNQRNFLTQGMARTVLTLPIHVWSASCGGCQSSWSRWLWQDTAVWQVAATAAGWDTKFIRLLSRRWRALCLSTLTAITIHLLCSKAFTFPPIFNQMLFPVVFPERLISV